jgi:hypothetical protein
MAQYFAGLEVSPEVKEAMRRLLADVIATERLRAAQAAAENVELRRGLLAALQLEALPCGVVEALQAVSGVCRTPLPAPQPGRESGYEADAAFQRQIAIVQTVRELGAAGTAGGVFRASARDVSTFLMDLLLNINCSAEGGELPRHAAAFADAAVRLVAGEGAEMLRSLTAQMTTALVDPQTDEAQAAALSCAMARFASSPDKSAARTLLLAATTSLHDACASCADAARATAARPFAAPSGEHEDNKAYAAGRRALLLLPCIDASLRAIGESSAADRLAALEALAEFARVHAKSQRLTGRVLGLQSAGLLSAAVMHVTAAANACALQMLMY